MADEQVFGMFEGNTNCKICRKELDDKNRKSSVGMDGYTYSFCKECFKNKKDSIDRILRPDNLE